MKGSIQQIERKTKTVHRARIDVPSPDEDRKQISKTFDEEGDATTWLIQKNHEISTGTLVTPSEMSMKQYLQKWMEDERDAIRPKTHQKRQWAMNHILPALGHVEVGDLTPYHLQTLYQDRLEDLAPSSVKNLHEILHNALRNACRLEIIADNPAKNVSPPAKPDPDFTVLDGEQIERYLSAARGRRYYPVLLTLVMTGLRRGEALGLRWEDVSLDEASLSVRKTLGRTDEGLGLGDVKTASSRRSVALMEANVKALRDWKQRQLQERLNHPDLAGRSELVYTTSEGNPVHPRSLLRSHNKVVDQADVPDVTIHDLRHTHATQMLRNGTHPKVVQERLGHSRIEVTMDTYSHVLPGMQEDAVEALEQSMGADTV